MDKQDSREYRGPRNNMLRKRKKVCVFCADKSEYIDFKDTARLR